jgi:hypothetical protein
MSTERAKGYWRGLNPDEQIEAVLQNNVSEDRSGIDNNPFLGELSAWSPSGMRGGRQFTGRP